MAQQRYTHHHTLDPFAALGTCHVELRERAVQAHLAEQACLTEPRRTTAAVARAVRAWIREHSPAYRRISRRRPA
jgi:hypothetical protein